MATQTQGFNFRTTAIYVMDGTDEVEVIEVGGYADLYDTDREGQTFGWDVGTLQTRNRDATNDRRLAGVHFAGDGTTPKFRIDLDNMNGAGSYDIRSANGDDYGAFTAVNGDFLDNATSKFTISGDTGSTTQWLDSKSTALSNANWPGSNVAETGVSFSSEIFFYEMERLDATPLNALIAHLEFEWVVGGAPLNTLALMGVGS